MRFSNSVITASALFLLGILSSPVFATDAPAPTLDVWSIHAQFTAIPEAHEPFTSPYSGPDSLYPGTEGRTSVSSTFYLDRRLWRGGSIVLNPEVLGGQGFSGTRGVAGFPNGEIYRVAGASPKIVLSRIYLQQIIGFSDAVEQLSTDQNQLAGPVAVDRLTIVAGMFSLSDFFDANTYSHDPRTQFMNWALFTNGAWDYAADSRGYTNAIYAEYNRADWAIRAASAMEPRQANQLVLDSRIGDAHGDELEFERRYAINDLHGKLRFLGYWNHAHMGSYQAAIADGLAANAPPNIIATRAYSDKYGFGVNVEQELTKDLGLFSRAGWNDGRTETWAFTEIDRTFQAGLSLKGKAWRRPDDVLASAFVVNGLSPDHRAYLAAGGIGLLLGDGQLNYAPEQIWETYYAVNLWKYLTLTPDLQLIKNPAYNADRGPVVVWSFRVHIQF